MSERKPLTDEQLDDIWKEMLKPDAERPPRLDRSAWKPCAKCRSCFSCSHVVESARDSRNACFWCDHKEKFKPMNFCPNCGRPLTDAAWEMLEKRLEGLN